MAAYILPVAAAKVKASRTNFAFFQGKKSNQVYISPRPAGPAQIAELNAECGEPKQLFKGVCFIENEQMVFATKAKPSMTWEVMITKVFKEKKAGKYLPVVLRQLGANESDQIVAGESEDGAAVPAAPATTEENPKAATDSGVTDEEGEWRKVKADVAPRLSAAIKANPENRDELVGLLSQALEREKAGQFADARTIFFQLMGRLPAPSADGAPPPPPPPKTPPPGGKVLSASELSLAMQKIVPRLQQAVTANPSRRAEILAPATKFQALLRAGKFAEAQAAMMEALALVKTLAPVTPAAPGSTVPPAPAAPPPPATSESPADAAESEEDAEDAEDARAYNEAEEAAFSATWGKASKVWMDCVETVDGQIEKVRTAMQNSGDPDFEEIADKGMAALTANHKTPVMVALREVDGARGEKRAAAAKKARAAIGSFRDHVLSDERIAVCDEECEAEFGVALNIREEISRGLDELEIALDHLP